MTKKTDEATTIDKKAQESSLTLEEAIAQQDAASVNLPDNLATLKFVAARDIFVAVLEVKAIYPDGRLDLSVQPYSPAAPVGMRVSGVAPSPSESFFPKVRRDDSGREAGTYKILSKV